MQASLHTLGAPQHQPRFIAFSSKHVAPSRILSPLNYGLVAPSRPKSHHRHHHGQGCWYSAEKG